MLVEFYKKVISSLKLELEDDFIMTSTNTGPEQVLAGGKPMVLPTKEHLASLLGYDEDDKLTIFKIPFNPLAEDAVKGDAMSVIRSKTSVELRISQAIGFATLLLLEVASNTELQKKTNIEINEFLSSLSAAQRPNITQLVDEKLINKFIAIIQNAAKISNGLISIYLKKQGIKNGAKFTRLASLTVTLYDELVKVCNKETTKVYNVDLRPKDAIILKLALEFLLPGIEEGVISFGTNDKESPAFIALFTLYLTVMEKPLRILTQLKNVNEDFYDAGYVDISLTLDEVTNLSGYKHELALIPNEIQLTRDQVTASKAKTAMPVIQNNVNRDIGDLPVMTQPQTLQPAPQLAVAQPQYQQPQYQQPQQPVPYVATKDPFDGDPFKKALYQNNPPMMGPNGGMYMQPPMQVAVDRTVIDDANRQRQMEAQRYQQQFAAQQYGQPMYGQPVYNQPTQPQPWNNPVQQQYVQPQYQQPQYQQPQQQYGQGYQPSQYQQPQPQFQRPWSNPVTSQSNFNIGTTSSSLYGV